MSFLTFTDETIHVVLVAFAGLVLLISLLAYFDRRSPRLLFLSLAFAFLTGSQSVEMIESLFYSSQLFVIPTTGIHLSHFLDFLMLSSFSIALLTTQKEKIDRRRNE